MTYEPLTTNPDDGPGRGSAHHPTPAHHPTTMSEPDAPHLRDAAASSVADLPLPEIADFLGQRRQAVVSLMGPGGRVHATPVKAVYELASSAPWVGVLISSRSVKARLARRPRARAAVTEHDAARWATLEGPCVVTVDPERLADARARYQRRFSRPASWGDALLVVEVSRALTGR